MSLQTSVMWKLMPRLKSKNTVLGKRRKKEGGKRRKSKRKSPPLAQDRGVAQRQGQNQNWTPNNHKKCRWSL